MASPGAVCRDATDTGAYRRAGEKNYPQFDIEPFTAAAVAKGPDVMVGTFTPVNAQGQTAGTVRPSGSAWSWST